MSLKRTPYVFGLAAFGALLAVGVAQAAPRLVSVKKDAMHGAPPLFRSLGVNPNVVPKLPVSDSVTATPGVETFIDGWALIDESACQQLGIQQPFVVHPDKKDKLMYRSDLITAALGDGACAGQEFTFSALYVTWPAGGRAGATHSNHFTEVTTHIKPNNFGLPQRAGIVDFVQVTLGS